MIIKFKAFETFDDGLKRKEEEYRRMFSNDRPEKPEKLYKEEDHYYYTIKEGIFLVCDLDCCAKSERTFDIRFDDFATNKKLQEVLFSKYQSDRIFFAEKLSYYDKKKSNKLLDKNPKLRILVQDTDLFVDVLEVFHPDDFRVKVKKYNI